MVGPDTGIVNSRQALLPVPIYLSTVTLVAPESVPAIFPIEPVPKALDITVTACALKWMVALAAADKILLAPMDNLAPPLSRNVLLAATAWFTFKHTLSPERTVILLLPTGNVEALAQSPPPWSYSQMEGLLKFPLALLLKSAPATACELIENVLLPPKLRE